MLGRKPTHILPAKIMFYRGCGFKCLTLFASGDGTSQLICFIGELLKQADGYIADGVHPRLINDGFRLASDQATVPLFLSGSARLAEYFHSRANTSQPSDNIEPRSKAKKAIEKLSVAKEMSRDVLLQVARTSLRTKLDAELADKLTEAIVDAVMAIRQKGEEINLHMVEIMEMQHRSVRALFTRFVA